MTPSDRCRWALVLSVVTMTVVWALNHPCCSIAEGQDVVTMLRIAFVWLLIHLPLIASLGAAAMGPTARMVLALAMSLGALVSVAELTFGWMEGPGLLLYGLVSTAAYAAQYYTLGRLDPAPGLTVRIRKGA